MSLAATVKKDMEDQRNYDKGRSTEGDEKLGRTNNTTNQHKGEAKEKGAEETKIYLTSDSTLQTPEEAAEDHNSGMKEEHISVSRDDLHETNADKRAGSDRAGTAERKNNVVGSEDIDLNDINANKKAREEDAESAE